VRVRIACLPFVPFLLHFQKQAFRYPPPQSPTPFHSSNFVCFSFIFFHISGDTSAAHSASVPKLARACMVFHNNGSCGRGNTCHFSHDPGVIAAAFGTVPVPVGGPEGLDSSTYSNSSSRSAHNEDLALGELSSARTYSNISNARTYSNISSGSSSSGSSNTSSGSSSSSSSGSGSGSGASGLPSSLEQQKRNEKEFLACYKWKNGR
jgi:uncharacterized membrane protein YgcG